MLLLKLERFYNSGLGMGNSGLGMAIPYFGMLLGLPSGLYVTMFL